MKKVLFILIFLLPLYLFSQHTPDYIIYLDSSFKKISENNHVYKKIIREYFFVKEQYNVELYYKSGQLKRTGTTKNKEVDKYEGMLTSFYENGNVYQKIFYQDGLPFSTYKTWYENGKKRDEGLYIAGSATNPKQRKLRINQYWDENDIQKVTNGEGTYIEQSGKLSLKGKIKKGLKDSIWTGQHNDYNLTFEEEYSNGEFVSGVSIDKNSIKYTYKEIQQNPVPKKGINHFYNFVSKRFNVRADYEGTAKIILSFIVNKNGAIEEVTVLKGVNSALDKEAVRLLNAYADWQPGKHRGIEVRVLYNIPIVFDL